MNFKKMVLAAVAMVFAFSAHSGELVKKKDSFAEAAPPNFAMAHAVETETCHRSGDIGMSEDGLILSCQSGKWLRNGLHSPEIVGAVIPSNSGLNHVIAYCKPPKKLVSGFCNYDGGTASQVFDGSGPLSDLTGFYCTNYGHRAYGTLTASAICANY